MEPPATKRKFINIRAKIGLISESMLTEEAIFLLDQANLPELLKEVTSSRHHKTMCWGVNDCNGNYAGEFIVSLSPR